MNKPNIHRSHPFAEHFNEATRVYYLGPGVLRLRHDCPDKKKSGGSPEYLDLYQASYITAPMAGCAKCNRLYIGEEAPHDVHRSAEQQSPPAAGPDEHQPG